MQLTKENIQKLSVNYNLPLKQKKYKNKLLISFPFQNQCDETIDSIEQIYLLIRKLNRYFNTEKVKRRTMRRHCAHGIETYLSHRSFYVSRKQD